MPRPLKDNKMRPRIAETAKTLWLIYVLLTVACALALWGQGCRCSTPLATFSTIAIGGFSTHDASIGYYASPTINTIIAVFLLISAVTTACLRFAKRSQSEGVWARSQFRMFIFVQLTLVVVCTLVLWGMASIRAVWKRSIRRSSSGGIDGDHGRFYDRQHRQVAAVSAYVVAVLGVHRRLRRLDRRWPEGDLVPLPGLQGSRELKKAIPNAVYTIKLGNRALPERILECGDLFCLCVVFIVSMLAIIATGVDDFPRSPQ